MRKGYWVLWVFTVAFLLYCLSAQQVSGLFFRFMLDNPWLLYIFTQFGVLIMGAALLIYEEAVWRGYPRLVLLMIGPYFVVGALALFPFLALRGEPQVGASQPSAQPALTLGDEWRALRHPPAQPVAQPPPWVNRRWPWLLLAVLLFATLIYAIQAGDLRKTQEAITLDPTLGFMVFDFVINAIFVVPLILADAGRRGFQGRSYAVLTAFTGGIGLSYYLWLRTRLAIR